MTFRETFIALYISTSQLFIIIVPSEDVAAGSVSNGEKLETTQMSSHRGTARLNTLQGVN